MPGNNAAKRVHRYIDSALQVPGDRKMVDGMNIVFGRHISGDAIVVGRRVMQDLELFLRQVDATETACKAAAVPDEIFVSQIARVRAAFNPTNMHQPFSQVLGHLAGDVKTAFASIAFILPPDDPVDIDHEALKRLLSALRDARDDPVIDSLPRELRDFVRKHLDSLLAALSDYELAGSAPLQRAVKEFATDLISMDEAVDAEVKRATPAQRSALAKAAAAIKKAVEVVGSAGKAADGIGKIWKLAEPIVKALGWNGGAPPGAG